MQKTSVKPKKHVFYCVVHLFKGSWVVFVGGCRGREAVGGCLPAVFVLFVWRLLGPFPMYSADVASLVGVLQFSPFQFFQRDHNIPSPPARACL